MTAAEPRIHLDESTHVYSVGGVCYPSVTTILRLAKLADFSAIPEWIKPFVLARGKATHAAGHYLLEGDLDESSLDPAIVGYIEALKSFLFHSGFEPEPGMIECRIFDPLYRYCGTLDVVGTLPQLRRHRVIVDWKSGLMSGVEYQLAAYLRRVRGVYYRASVKLNRDGTYRVVTYSPADLKRDEDTFLDALSDLRRGGILP